MNLKRVFTVLTAVAAVGTAFAGNVNVKKLLVNEGWYREVSEGNFQRIDTDIVERDCVDTGDETCAVYFNEDETQGPIVYYPS